MLHFGSTKIRVYCYKIIIEISQNPFKLALSHSGAPIVTLLQLLQNGLHLAFRLLLPILHLYSGAYLSHKLLFFCWFVFGSIGAYGNDSILVNREWTERQTIYVKETAIDSIGEDSVIENNGIACGNDGCIKMEFLDNYQIRKIYPNGRVRHGKWILEDNILTIVYDEKERWEKKKCRFKIKYRNKKGYPTLYLFAIKGRVRASYIFCNYN